MLEDGITDSRRDVLGGTFIPRRPPAPSGAPTTNRVAPRTAGLAKAPGQSELLREAQRLFDAMGAHLPPRISTEELGDALEALQKMAKEGQPKWKIQARILSTLFWVSAHSVQDGVYSLIGTETAATGNNSGKGHE